MHRLLARSSGFSVKIDRVSIISLLLCIGVIVASGWLTWLVRKGALARGMLDLPNWRSSHTVPTPRGGGVAIVVAASGSIGITAMVMGLDVPLAMALLGGGLPVALVGYLDDRRSLSVRVRMGVHLLAASWAVYNLGGLAPLQIGACKLDLGFFGDVVAVLSVVWALNLFNFMDGIDGLAGSEAVFVSAAGAGLVVFSGLPQDTAVAGFLIAAASAGFLLWNWPPARIFMGDSGSCYLGYSLAVLALSVGRANPGIFFAWVILGGVFFVDSTVTLVRRIASGERLYEAHRSHAYQRLARRWGSHRRVTLAVLAINLFWLYPMALLAMRLPNWASVVSGIAFVPLIILAWAIGSGRKEVD